MVESDIEGQEGGAGEDGRFEGHGGNSYLTESRSQDECPFTMVTQPMNNSDINASTTDLQRALKKSLQIATAALDSTEHLRKNLESSFQKVELLEWRVQQKRQSIISNSSENRTLK